MSMFFHFTVHELLHPTLEVEVGVSLHSQEPKNELAIFHSFVRRLRVADFEQEWILGELIQHIIVGAAIHAVAKFGIFQLNGPAIKSLKNFKL